ncbi:MAG: hypothetical protein M3Y22_02050 [Pseudomonadota bacterium]|nr:hypothetical protein [Pseudomonadota bacterium]
MANVFAFRDSRLNAFLFSDVGMEPNGTSLTILSLLARLGKDPWDEAAAWARQPKDAAIRLLTDSISRMPPSQQAFDDAQLTASRLVNLLPAPEAPKVAAAMWPALAATPKGGLLALLYLSLFLVFNLWLAAAAPRPDAAAAAAPAIHAVAASTK